MLEMTCFRVLSATMILASALSGCGEDAGGGAGGDGSGGAGGAMASGPGATSSDGSTSGPGATSSASSTTGPVGPSAQSSAGSGGQGGGGGNPPLDACEGVDEASLYAQTAVDFSTGETVNLCNFQGQVLMIVNIAAHCGYTPQMTGLQLLEQTFAADGFHVLGFLSDDFDQAGSHDDVEACNTEHHVSFQEFDLGAVTNSPEATPQPVFAWIEAQTDPGPAAPPLEPVWNFNKYIISRSGQLVGHYTQSEYWGTDTALPEFEASLAVQKIREQLAN